MKTIKPNWSLNDLAHAMENAIYSRAIPKLIRKHENKISFNGFWRDGEKQNVCVWLDKASFHDAKTGNSGGCKEFAQTAFNMNLAEFMTIYGSRYEMSKVYEKPNKTVLNQKIASSKSIHTIWQQLQKAEQTKTDQASKWLSEKRGIESPRINLKNGFANLTENDARFFSPEHQSFITHRAKLGQQIAVPLRSSASEEVKNLFIRSIAPVPKEEKSRLLPNAGGWTEADSSPRAFGFPHLIKESAQIILCEGMADYFATEFLLNSNQDFLAIGAANADGLTKWAKWLTNIAYKGRVIVLYQLDGDSNDTLSTKKIGPAKAIETLRYLKESHIEATLFDWPFYLRHTTTHPTSINDIADSLSTELKYKECAVGHLQDIFLLSLGGKGK